MENEQTQAQKPYPKKAVQKNFLDQIIFSRKLQKANKNGSNLKIAIPSKIVKRLGLQKQQVVEISIGHKEDKEIIEIEPTSEIIPRTEMKSNNPIAIIKKEPTEQEENTPATN